MSENRLISPASADQAAGLATARPQGLSPWIAVTGVLLLVTLMAAAFVQVRQFALLSQSVHSQDDYLALSLYQLELEYLRLREQLQVQVQVQGLTVDSSAAARVGGEQSDLQLRYDIFVSRLSLLNTARARRLLGQSHATDQVLRDLQSFTRRADLYLGPAPQGALSMQAAQALLIQMKTLDAPIHQMLVDASHDVAAQITSRQQQVRQHNSAGLALTVFLLCMVLVFAALALRQVRLLEQRRLRLQVLADELRDARIEAESASEAKSDFLADMSHELRTPLHGLLGMLSLVRDAPHDARATEWLATADDSAAHLLKLLDDMLDLSKLESGTLTLAPQPVALAPLLREVLTLLRPAATSKNLALQSDLATNLPEWVLLDPTRVKQVLFNLVSNAVKFSETGAVMLRCHASTHTFTNAHTDKPAAADGSQDSPDAAGPAMLEFDVVDSGIGIGDDTLPHLFKRFSRSEDPRARAQVGTGLGLAISRNMARLMGGDIRVHSMPGAGSAFNFRCPLQAADASAQAPVTAAPSAARQLRVLVAEDHPVNRLYIRALLERLGHQAKVVDNGVEALRAAQQQTWDLVLMDVHMPLMDGVAATSAIRALPGDHGRPCIVALTADVFGSTRERCLAAGAAEVVTKPMSMPMLQTVLDRHFEGLPSLQPMAAEPAGGADAQGLDETSMDAAQAPPGSVASDAQAPALLNPAVVRQVRALMPAGQSPSLYDSFFGQTDAARRAMREAMRRADTNALRREAHAVKGAALTLGLPALAEAASRLNHAPQALSAAELALAVQRFEELSVATLALCRAEGLAV